MSHIKLLTNKIILHGTVVSAPKRKDDTIIFNLQIIHKSFFKNGTPKVEKEVHQIRFVDNYETRFENLKVESKVFVTGEIRTFEGKKVIKAESINWSPGELKLENVIDDLN